MNSTLRFFLSILLALVVSLAFNYFFLDLFERSSTDQILLMAFSAVALGYLIFSAWGNIPFKLSLPRFDWGSISSLLREHAPGIVLAILFFAIYTWFGLQINFADSDTTDNFLEADNYPWMNRIAAPNGYQFEMRGPHPFAYFILRPFGLLLNSFTSSPWLSAILLNTFVGALCVFMAWVFIKRQSQNSTYALLIAALLGLSTSHFFFGAVIESYIFSAAALIGFVLTLQKSEGNLFAPVTMSVVTFGITLTNFAQNFIGFVVNQLSGLSRKTFRDFLVKIFQFAALVLSLGIVISVIHAAWYPSSRLFFQLSDAQIEGDFSLSVFQEPQWKITGRIILLIRTILLYTVIAPKPFVFGQEVGAWLPYFNFFKLTPQTYAYSSYNGLGNVLVFAWAILLFMSGVFFLWNLLRTRKIDLTLAFALSLLFNFFLHLSYGFETFLYSPDWAYALIFFVGLSLAPLAKNRLFQGALLVFLVLLAYNQVYFFQFILDTIAPFYGRGG
ncbi:hypothetical protein ANAEL_01353 [Anaerolineales bacterium]|nr:hypothetical protein ANAEL_01353 [Anaerolineales bacterium]